MIEAFVATLQFLWQDFNLAAVAWKSSRRLTV